MARLQYGRLTEAWKGEASDFTPLLAEQLDLIGAEIGVELASIGKSEVATAGGRRIDIVAEGDDGSEFVIENQYGRADHDHLTRGLAYAVARRARGLVVIAEEHRDEFRAVAQYLNELAEFDRDRGIAVWLVEAKAVKIEDSPWAPLFSTVVAPNAFTASVEGERQALVRLASVEEYLRQCSAPEVREAADAVIAHWRAKGHHVRLGRDNVVLGARGPAKSRYRTVVVLYTDGRVLVPLGSYDGMNSGIRIKRLVADEFRLRTQRLFSFDPERRQPWTLPAWLVPARTVELIDFCDQVAAAYAAALDDVDEWELADPETPEDPSAD